MPKYRMLRERIAARPGGIELTQASAASDGELALAHEPRYIQAVAEGQLSDAEQREIGFPWSPAMSERARRSVVATFFTERAALDEGVAAQLAGGTHHAYAHKGSGFCVFNDVAVAARLMQAETHRQHRRSLRVLVIDLDVHQGNGTAAIFRDDLHVFTFSIHGRNNFPLKKETSDLDLALPDGTGDRDYLEALQKGLAQAFSRARAQLVIYLSGADAYEGDRFGRLKLSKQGLWMRDRLVFGFCREYRLPVAVTLAGGYAPRIEDIVDIHFQTVKAAEEFCRCCKGSAPL